VVSAGYDEQALELELEFRSGHVYRYESVPPSVYAWLLRVENKGGFVRRMIHGHYAERAVPRSVPPASAPGEVSGAPQPDALEDALRASLERFKPGS
jgi:KTSC domain-containing protein